MSRKILFAIWLFMLAASPVRADEVLEYPYLDMDKERQTVEAVLRVPDKPNGKAVVILHHAGGWGVGTTSQYAALFVERGYTTIEPRMFNAKSQIVNTLEHLGQAMGALELLAKRPGIDPNQIYVIGLSYGSWLTVYAATDWVSQRFTQGKLRFRKAAAFYAVCWPLAAAVRGTLPDWARNPKYPDDLFNRLNGTALRFFVAGRDDYDSGDNAVCQSFIDAVPDKTGKSLLSVKIYPNATHAWDQGRNETWFERVGCKGRGCEVSAQDDPEVTAAAMQDLVRYFED